MTQSPSNGKQPRIPELDGLRGFAILQVISVHYFYNPDANLPAGLHFLQRLFALGWTGVDLFFVLSGFLIGGILLDARDSPNYFKTFYIRRFFRIAPLYYFWLFCLIALVSLRILPFQAQSAPAGTDWQLWGHFYFFKISGSFTTPPSQFGGSASRGRWQSRNSFTSWLLFWFDSCRGET
jgi:peptidoglycan/LPS O-acetylase OafA/YrhL